MTIMGDQSTLGLQISHSLSFEWLFHIPLFSMNPPRHLPYEINPDNNRFHYYETYWKHCALNLLLKHHAPRDSTTILDYGCGRGEALQIFGDAGYQVTGTDVDPKCVEYSNQYGNAVVLDYKDPLNQFGEDSFDYVTCFHVLEHVENPLAVIQALSKIARKGAVFAVPNLCHLSNIFRRKIYWEAINEGHLQSWDHAHFQSLLTRHGGFELEEWGFDATLLPIVNRFGPGLLGQKNLIRLETGLFRRLFPFHGISVLGLFKKKEAVTT
jgi:SAM-dependent methyltransferase